MPHARRAAGPAVAVMVESPLWRAVPGVRRVVRHAIARAADAAAGANGDSRPVAVLLCDDARIAELNGRWRGKNQATNVLSFPAASAAGGTVAPVPLGDIAVAYETMAREAAAHDKEPADHLAHLVVHGFLHLLGYDHDRRGAAELMERLERDILGRIGIADPYAWRDAGH
jgi:probable rRNA maturation factor